MTVLVENNNNQQAGAGGATPVASELEVKVFKVLAAFSQTVEKALITSQSNVNDLYNHLNIPVPQQPELKTLNQINTESNNFGLLTIQLVRTVIQRSDALAKQITNLNTQSKNNINSNNNNSNNSKINNNNNTEINNYKLEIESLKKKITALQEQQQTSGASKNLSTSIPNLQSDEILTAASATATTATTLASGDSFISSKENSSESLSSVRVRNEEMRDSSDWDTKYQTEMQLNSLLSEFFKNEIEISGDQMMDEELLSTPREDSSSSSAALASTELPVTNGYSSISSGSSPIVTPTIGASDKTLSSSGSFTSHSPLTHSASSTSILGNSSPSSSSTNLAYGDSPSRQSTSNLAAAAGAPKKAYLTDLLDQIDLENNTPSKDKKKGKFKFF